VIGGGGTLTDVNVLTDDDGKAVSTLIPGSDSSVNSVLVTSSNTPSQRVLFNAIVLPVLTGVTPPNIWPGFPADLEITIKGEGLTSDAVVVWDVGGAQLELPAIIVDTGTIKTSIPASQLGQEAVYDLAVRQGGLMCPSIGFTVAVTPRLPDTGQLYCYDGTMRILCPGSGDDFFGQDAQYGWDLFVTPEQRFSKSEPVNGQPMVYDNLTSTMWQGCTAEQNGETCGQGTLEKKEWPEAVSYCENLDWGGYDDWILPPVQKLLTLVNFGGSAPFIYQAVFPGTPSFSFWSSPPSLASYPEDPVWYVNFTNGVTAYYPEIAPIYVRCMRSSTTNNNIFDKVLDSPGEPVVLHDNTGLMWQGCMAGQSGNDCATGGISYVTWETALDYCATLEWGGYSDWRFPSLSELLSIIDTGLSLPAMDVSIFPQPQSGYIWTSTPSENNPGEVWWVELAYGITASRSKTMSESVRCVRSGITM
jgi:hypothetical protein